MVASKSPLSKIKEENAEEEQKQKSILNKVARTLKKLPKLRIILKKNNE